MRRVPPTDENELAKIALHASLQASERLSLWPAPGSASIALML